MSEAMRASATIRLSGGAGLSAELNANRSLRRFDCGNVSLLLFPGNEMEGGLTNLYLRRHGESLTWTCLLGPRSPSSPGSQPSPGQWRGAGQWGGVRYELELRFSARAAVWFWLVRLVNNTAAAQTLDVTYVQDLALAPYGAARNNEYYCSQYIDHTPLAHATHGYLLGSRQNQAVDGRYPWTLLGSLRRSVAFATDALQFHGLSARSGAAPPGLQAELPTRRLQHEHSLVALRDEPLRLEAGQSVSCGFFGVFLPDHAQATSAADLERLPAILALPEAALPGAALAAAGPTAVAPPGGAQPTPSSATLFSHAMALETLEPGQAQLQVHCPGPWRHLERDAQGRLLSFFHGEARHVVMREKELQVLRPHGQLLRTGRQLTPAESALTSTVWMAGVFHSMVAQGHVGINRFLSTVRSYLGLFRSHGQRVFVEIDGRWQLLQLPSLFEMSAQACRWLYAHRGGLIEVRSEALSDPHALTLTLQIVEGAPMRFLIAHHVAFSADDGAAGGAVCWRREGDDIRVIPPEGSELARRFAGGSFCLTLGPDTRLERIGGDELLCVDAVPRGQSYLCLLSAPARRIELRLRGELLREETQSPICAGSEAQLIPQVQIEVPVDSHEPRLVEAAARLAEIVPWFAQNAWVHFLSPRGLEQFSGGGWGTRDVCQGPVELLLALGRTEPIREILLRVMGAQNPDGDWPQWFMPFERERLIRAGDSQGDIVLWPLVVVAQYLMASGDGALLDEPVPFFDARGVTAGETVSVWRHVERALGVLQRRTVPGSLLAAYGHGDWNDSLQPADPRLREHMCSAWTVTLQVQALRALAAALRHVGREQARAAQLAALAEAVLAEFQRLLIADGVLTGYAIFETDGQRRYLLHPRDQLTGVQYSALGMIHAILEDLFTPAQAREHLRIIETQLSGPDGARLFDRPMPYHGGPQRIFQRAESATFFGREIGLMYTHAHLRYAQALAHLGEAERFLHALSQAVPIGIQSLVPSADRRQANCYFSSSDAAFADRYEARAEYERVQRGQIGFDGGWRVYSSGAGIALSLILRRFLGWEPRREALRLDPVIPAGLDGLRATLLLWGYTLEVRYRIGAAGCGVQGVRLNGQAVSFEREAHAHRLGAVLAPREPLQRQLREGGNEFEILMG